MKLRRNARSERGAVAVIATAGLVLAMISAGLAVDLGSLAQEARNNQKIADLAALDAVRLLPADPTAAAVASAKRNKIECPDDTDPSDGCGLKVEWSDGITGIFSNLLPPTLLTRAVRVTVTSPHENDFPFVPSGDTVSRKATASLGNGTGCFYPTLCEETPGATEAAISPLGAVRVGSSLASFSSTEAVILNRLLTRTVGGTYTLDAAGWNGLAAGNVQFSKLRGSLGGSYAIGSPDGVLDADLKYRELLDATVDALNADGSPSTATSSTAARNALITLRGQVAATAGADIRLRRIFEIAGNVGSGEDVADATINVKDIVVGGMILADGDHLASMDLSATDIPGLPGNGVTVRFGLIEAPKTERGAPKDSFGAYRTTARTAQIRLVIESNVVVPITGMGNLNLKVPYYLSGAGATASLDTLDCAAGDDDPATVDIFGVTEVAKAYLGTVADAQLGDPTIPTAAAVSTPIGSVTASVTVPLLGTVNTTVTVSASGNVISSVPGSSGHLVFTPAYDGVTSKPVPGSTQLTLPTAVGGNMTVAVTGTLPVGVTVASIENAISQVVNPTLGPLNNLLVKRLQWALGLSLGAADVWAPPVQLCNPTSFNTDPTSSVGPEAPYGYQIPALVG